MYMYISIYTYTYIYNIYIYNDIQLSYHSTAGLKGHLIIGIKLQLLVGKKGHSRIHSSHCFPMVSPWLVSQEKF